jgi:Protein of unknown function (DUF3021).
MKNKLLNKILNSIIYPACVCFTVCIFITSIIATLGNEKSMAANLNFMTLLFAFSLFMAVINKIFDTKMNIVLKIVCHFIGTFVSFCLVFIVFSGYYATGKGIFIIIILMVLVYAIVMSVIMYIKSLFAKDKNKKTDYKSQFGP